MKVVLVYKSFNTPEKTLHTGDIVEGDYAVYLFNTFPEWFEEVVEIVEVDDNVVEEQLDSFEVLKKKGPRIKKGKE